MFFDLTIFVWSCHPVYISLIQHQNNIAHKKSNKCNKYNERNDNNVDEEETFSFSIDVSFSFYIAKVEEFFFKLHVTKKC